MSRNDLHHRVGDFIHEVHTTLHIDQSVDDALSTVRHGQIHEKIFYFYVIDDERHLKGVVSTRNLLLSLPDKKVHEILDDHLISITEEHTLREAMELLNAHRLLALPVVDRDNRFLGIIDIQLYLEEAIDLATAKKSSTDVFQVLGLDIEDGKARSKWSTYKDRMPWVLCNMFGGIMCAVISRAFELVLINVIILAMFIPLVLSLSESISMQSMSYSLQLLQRPRISWRRILQRLKSESSMVFLLGATCALLVGSISLFWGDGFGPALSISSGILISVTIAGTAGGAIPLLLHALKLDPKVAAGPVVLMFADILTTAIYLSLATWWLL